MPDSFMPQMDEAIQRCREDRPPQCQAACPFGLDIRMLTQRISRGSFDYAYKAYRNAVGFPDIVARLCPAPCASACIVDGQPLQLPRLERAVVEYAKHKRPNRYNVPRKDKRIAVVGGGLSGLALALRMAEKNYALTLFEQEQQPGGTLKDLLPADIYLADIERQLEFARPEIMLGRRISSLDDLAGYDAAYIATGADGDDFGLLAKPRPGFFPGGSLLGSDKMTALAGALAAVDALELWLTTGAFKPQAAHPPAGRARSIAPSCGMYEQAEAQDEAARCLQCRCDSCQANCELLAYAHKQPKRFKDEIDNTVYPKNVDGHGKTVKRLMAACLDCGRCAETCPEQIDFRAFIHHGQELLRQKQQTPPAFHDFWLRDFAQASGAEAALTIAPASADADAQPNTVFFPGCQLGASDPRYVQAAYELLRQSDAHTGLWLDCCGAPAYWGDGNEQHQRHLQHIQRQWQELGRPRLILACPTCRRMFAQFLPQIPCDFFYQLPQVQTWAAAKNGAGELAVFDPCASRAYPGLQQAVRQLAQQAGYTLHELSTAGAEARCCGYGGQGAIAEPHLAEYIRERRLALSDLPYLTYCSNCRDIFALGGKQALHLLDILFDLDDGCRPAPLWSERRDHRRRLKAHYLPEATQPAANGVRLLIADELRRELSAAYILEEEIAAVIEHCEASGERLRDLQSGHYFGHLRQGCLTYWAEYSPEANGCYTLHDAYAHRMSVEQEAGHER
ncbi:MAG: heterodisulfide reductase-related iron-sulfur binding cluster [Bacillota bacterium]|nr:heterodisulfide reductase-related iron-sulfur binding cluster [Bacillota bacterium]